jgi:hypothetical protein
MPIRLEVPPPSGLVMLASRRGTTTTKKRAQRESSCEGQRWKRKERDIMSEGLLEAA